MGYAEVGAAAIVEARNALHCHVLHAVPLVVLRCTPPVQVPLLYPALLHWASHASMTGSAMCSVRTSGAARQQQQLRHRQYINATWA